MSQLLPNPALLAVISTLTRARKTSVAPARYSGLADYPREREVGQALVEFALVLPMLILLLMGMFDLGRGVYAYNVVASAAREGARYAVVKPTDPTGVRTKALAVTPALDQTQLAMDAMACKDQSGNTSSCTIGNNVTITVRYRFRPITAFFATLNLVGKSTMTIE